MTRIPVDLPAGRVTVSAELTRPVAAPWAAMVLAHGAGAGMDHPFLRGFADSLGGAGVATLRFTFPYREAGRRMPGPAAHAIATWEAATGELARALPGVPQVAAGKSYGGRMASMAAAEGRIAPAALVYLGYPYHPPGKPDATRGAHLRDVAAPQLFVTGTADPFVQPGEDFARAVEVSPDAEIVWIDGGGHSFEVRGRRRAPEEVGADLAAVVVGWLRSRLAPGAGA